MTAPVPAASDEQSPAPQDTPAPEAADGAAEAVVESQTGDEVQADGAGADESVAAELTEAEAAIADAPIADAPVAEAPVAEAPVKAIPDRADAPVSEVTERFLRAVVASVPVELIEELHLFSPLRQGTVETGIAVLAARVPIALAEENGEPELPFAAEAEVVADIATQASENDESPDGGSAGDASTSDESASGEDVIVADEHIGDDAPVGDEAIVIDDDSVVVVAAGEIVDEAEDVDVAASDDIDVVADAVVGDVVADVIVEDVAADVAENVAEEVVEDVDVVAAEGDDDEDVSIAEAPVADASADESDEAEAIIETAIEAAPVKAARPVRHTVYTARYRYVIKGPERGKWESNVKAEADAPLITVETVVRGVQRRAGEESEIVRYSGAQIARALRIPYTA